MSRNTNTYDIDRHIAEIYDGVETQLDDVALLRKLIEGRGPLRILEPFCGTGRILIPLAQDGHTLIGMDQSQSMLDYACAKIAQLPGHICHRIELIEADVTTAPWPGEVDLVILGANCFYELATPEEQEGCIAAAARALCPDGYVYVDNNHMEGELEESWRQPGVNTGRFPSGVCPDGTRLEGTTETFWWDAPQRLVRFRRGLTITFPDGASATRAWEQQKHPVSTGEVRAWLHRYGFEIQHLYGDRHETPYTESAGRAIFWARKETNSV